MKNSIIVAMKFKDSLFINLHLILLSHADAVLDWEPLSIPQIGVMAYQFNNNHSGEQRNSTPRSLQMKPDR